jgi:transcriptional regulator with XRE-family HTH domain
MRLRGQDELVRRRLDRKLSQAKVAELIGVRQATISGWEQKDGLRPTERTHQDALEQLLGIEPEWWFTAEELAEMEARQKRLLEHRSAQSEG